MIGHMYIYYLMNYNKLWKSGGFTTKKNNNWFEKVVKINCLFLATIPRSARKSR